MNKALWRGASSAALLTVLHLVGLPAVAEEQLPDKLSYQDTFNLEYPASLLFSEDGKTVIYERRSMDIMKDRTHTSLWQVSVDGKQHRPLLANDANIRQATISPDGSMLAYVSDQSGSAQIYVRYLDTDQQAKLTNLQHSPGNLTWSRDSSQLAFTMFTPAEEQALFNGMPKKPEGAKWAEKAKFIETTQYRSDGAGYLPIGFSQIYVLPIAGGTPRQLTTGNFPNSSSLSFSADNSAIYFSADRREDYPMRPLESDIFKVSVASAQVERVTEMPGPESDPKLSPDGTKLAFMQLQDRKLSYQNSDIMVLDLKSGSTKRLTEKTDRALQDFHWAADSKSIFYSYLDQGSHHLARVNLSGKVEKLSASLGGQSLGRPYTSGEFAVSKNGTVAFTTAAMTRPGDVAILTKSGDTKVLTDLNSDALGHLQMAEVKPLAVTSSVDERKIDAWMALPPNFDASKSYPLILEIHGGPHAAYGPHFSMEIQLMAAQGYVVVWSNPRGSSSYGEDFGNLIHHNYPSEDYNDLMDVVDAAIAKGYVDTNNLFITGGSGGGVLTAWSIGKTDRFRAAVVAKPVINWMSFALTADAYPFFSQYWMPKMPWEIADHLWKHSPLSLVGNVTTPTLLLTGEADYRTPISESEQFYQALRLKGVEAAMVRIPGASHGIASRPSRLIQKVGNILAWFERYKKEDAKGNANDS